MPFCVVALNPNKDKTAIDGYSSYLYCSYSGKAGLARTCRSGRREVGRGNEWSALAEFVIQEYGLGTRAL